MSAAKHTPGPLRSAMLALATEGYVVRERWLGEYYDGLSATKKVGTHRVEVFAGGADDGDPGDMHYAPVVYLNDQRIAEAPTVERARRIADLRAILCRAAIAKATGGAT